MKIVYWAHMKLGQVMVAELLKSEPDVDLAVAKTVHELRATLPGAVGVVACDIPRDWVSEVGEMLRACDTLRWLHVVTAGREGFLAAKLPERIVMTGPAGAHSPVVAEHAMALVLAFTRRIPESAANTPKHIWNRRMLATMGSVEGRTMAIVGLGHAGRALAKLAKAFGMRVVAVTRSTKSDANVDEVHLLPALRDVLACADVIAVTIASSPETRHLIGAAELAACKPTAYLVNVARGAVIDQPALMDALKAGRIAGAGLDVMEPEPLPADHPLWDTPNLVITPHVAGGGSAASLARLGARVTENLARLRNGTLTPT